MCTSATLRSLDGHVIIGRNMDFAASLDPEVCAVPAGLVWKGAADGSPHRTSHAYIGAGMGDADYALVAEGVNDAGFAGCELYFSDFASYGDASAASASALRLAASEFLAFCLGTCATTHDLDDIVDSAELVGVPDPYTQVIAPLHWIFTDASGRCVVIEKTAEAFVLHENPLGVMTNSPDFRWQMTNLRNYLSLGASQKEKVDWGGVEMRAFGEGFGMWGMPGDHTPPSRFVKTAFQKTHLEPPKTGPEAVVGCFHLLDSVSLPKGSISLPQGGDEHTLYTAVMDASDRCYYFTTYDNREIVRVALEDTIFEEARISYLGKMVRPVSFGAL